MAIAGLSRRAELAASRVPGRPVDHRLRRHRTRRIRHPPLTTVRTDAVRLGPGGRRRPARPHRPARAVTTSTLPPAELVVRASTATPISPPNPNGDTHETHDSRQPCCRHLALGSAPPRCDGGGGGGDADEGQRGRTGPITIWYSNNQEEIAWGKEMVEAWNAAHADEKITAQEIPAGKSLRGGHRRRDHRRQRAVPDLQHRAGRGAAVPEAGRPGRAGRLPRTARSTSRTAPATAAEQYKSPDGKFYQLPWKSNPVMIFYNKEIFAKAGLDAGEARRWPRTTSSWRRPGRSSVGEGRAGRDLSRARRSEFFQSWFDFYPLFAAETGGKQLVEDGKAQFDSPGGAAGRGVLEDDLRRGPGAEGAVHRRLVRRRQGRHGDRRPVGDRGLRGQGRRGARCRCRPRTGKPAESIHTFSDAKNVAMYTACENRATAWEVLKFATSQEQDGALLEPRPARCRCARTCRPPTRTTSRRTRPTSSSPTRPRAPSRCRTCRTRRDLADLPGRLLEVGDLRQAADAATPSPPRRRRSTSSPASP